MMSKRLEAFLGMQICKTCGSLFYCSILRASSQQSFGGEEHDYQGNRFFDMVAYQLSCELQSSESPTLKNEKLQAYATSLAYQEILDHDRDGCQSTTCAQS